MMIRVFGQPKSRSGAFGGFIEAGSWYLVAGIWYAKWLNLQQELKMNVKKLELEISKFIYELETEDRLVRVGLKEKAETAKIYKKYKDLFTKEILDQIKGEVNQLEASQFFEEIRPLKKRESFLEVGPHKKLNRLDILERIYFTLAGSFIGLALSRDQDKITTYFSKAKVKIGDEELAFYQITPRISKEGNFEKREQYDKAGYKVKARINPKQLQLLKSEIKLIDKLGFGGYLDYYSLSKKIDYSNFYEVVKRIVAGTDRIWEKTIARVSSDVLKRPFKNINAGHLVYLRALSAFDNFYPSQKVVSSFQRWTGEIGLGDLLSKIKIDDEARERKNPRAVCYWPKPPEEIHLVIKPIGGEQDFEAMFHEGGHALHGAAIDASLPYSLKTLAHSNALTETYAFILEDLVFDPEFLTTYLNVSVFTGARIKWQASFVNLMMLRRYLGKFLYEYEMFSPKEMERLSQGPTLYKKNLDATTGFVHNKINWLSDMDSGFYSADYLRAWIAASQIRDYLLKKFGKRWFLNKRAGEFLRKLWARGVTDEAEDVVKRLGYKPWDTSLLVSGYKDLFVNY